MNEKEPLTSSGVEKGGGGGGGGEEFRNVYQQGSAAAMVGGCCAKVPGCCARYWNCGKAPPGQKKTFSSSLGVVLSMLGSVVGTGNIWRYPRIVANHAEQGGALVFLLVWALFLWLWSIPIILIEYGVGRFTRKGVIESFGRLIGPSYRLLGTFAAIVTFCIASYYSVLLGWCGYYFVQSCAHPLPEDEIKSKEVFDNLQSSHWPILCHFLSILLASLSVSRGVSTIEPVNKVIVPALLLIVVFCFYWSIFLPYASFGIKHMFSPTWSSFKNSKMWLDGLSQNAWDTGAGLGTFLTYSTYMKRSQGSVRLGTITPICNNVVSLLCGMIVFCNVFSTKMEEGQTLDEIVLLLKDNGPANTGLTFIWMPILFSNIGVGRFLSAIFFLCLTLAGLSSLIALLELVIHCLSDFGIRRIPATILTGTCAFLLGLGSAWDIDILVNQDSVWAYAMIISGLMLLFLVYRYGIFSFRKNIYNNYGIGDWPLPWLWVISVLSVTPLLGVLLIVWWMVEEIKNNTDTWWLFSKDSLAMVLAQWGGAIIIAISLNWIISPLKIKPPTSPKLRRFVGLFVKFEEEMTESASVADGTTSSLYIGPEGYGGGGRGGGGGGEGGGGEDEGLGSSVLRDSTFDTKKKKRVNIVKVEEITL